MRWSSARTIAALLLALSISTYVDATFTDGFQAYLTKTYGSETARNLTRLDLGVNGSFGGNFFSFPIRIYRDPVVFVHGLNSNAGSLEEIHSFFSNNGYGIGELYATSYGPVGASIDASSPIKCEYVKQVRQLIVAVRAYTNNKRVAVAGYSMGVPVARKAILGGRCIDTNEDLGSPLTEQICIFLSVAGANQGAVECNSAPTAAVCNKVNGFGAGSTFLKDINKQRGYEGDTRYAIGSKSDDVVGFANLSLPSSQINITLTNFTHADTCFNTLHSQYSLIARGFVTAWTAGKDSYAESKVSGLKCSGQVSGGENFEVGPHSSRRANSLNNQIDASDDDYHGEYNRQTKTFTFWSGFNYTLRGNPFKLRIQGGSDRG